MQELRDLFSCTIHPQGGALLRHDGVAVGLVGGGAPPWDLLASADQAAVGDVYHRMLLALDAPLDIYLLDQPAELHAELAAVSERQGRNPNAVQAAILGELVEFLGDLAQSSRSCSKQVIWTLTVAPTGAGLRSGLHLRSLLRRTSAGTPAPQRAANDQTEAARVALARAQEQARYLASALSTLGGTPPPRLLTAEEIARVLYQVADQVRAVRYPWTGSLLGRVARVVYAERGGAP